MASKENRNKIDEIEDLVAKGNYKQAFNIIKSIDKNDLSNEDSKRLEKYISLLKVDKIYIIVAIGLFIIIISYFLLVK